MLLRHNPDVSASGVGVGVGVGTAYSRMAAIPCESVRAWICAELA